MTNHDDVSLGLCNEWSYSYSYSGLSASLKYLSNQTFEVDEEGYDY